MNVDALLKEEVNIKWLPWIGVNFFAKPQKERLLIVGESHFYKPEEPGSWDKHQTPEFTREAVEEVIEGDIYNSMYEKLGPVVFNNETIELPKAVWNDIAYYNLVQTLIQSGKRPSYDDFYKGLETFLKVITILKPGICIFSGVSAADELVDVVEDSGFTLKGFKKFEKIEGVIPRSAILSAPEGHDIKIIFTLHFSRVKDPLQWHNFIKGEMENK